MMLLSENKYDDDDSVKPKLYKI